MKQAFSTTFNNYKHIYIDMPGFGKSSNEYILTTQNYATIMQSFFDTLKIEPEMIFGHSFGGKVATLLEPKNLVLLSTAGILEEKSTKVKAKIYLAKMFKSIGLGNITKLFRSKDVESMNEVMYATFKNVVDEDFSQVFQNYKGNTIILWGVNDTATSLQSGKIINSLIQNSFFKSYNGDHYFFLQFINEIENTIKEKIE
jgi:pimeloyl-ACP methyl ester carboxylesterase